ncbi:hypothetical protein REPUB_Repub15cG0079400 [Reevesia pubescens]
MASAQSKEEEDLVERSAKKIKQGNDNGIHREGMKTFRETLIGSKFFKDCYLGSSSVEEKEVESDDDEDILHDDGIPIVKIPASLKKSLRDPWRSTLIIKLLGKSITYNVLLHKVTQLWKLGGEFELIDLGYGFYAVKFERMDDRFRVLTEGPWKIMDHYLTVQRWRPLFRPSQATIGSTAVWVHLPELPLEFFNEDVLMEIGRILGKPLKIDSTTALATRGKFARICVEVNLQKPLVSKIRVGKYLQRIEYEGLHTVCFHCGIVGHRSDNCLEHLTEKAAAARDRKTTTTEVTVENGDVITGIGGDYHANFSNSVDGDNVGRDNFGPWMLVQRKNRKPQFLADKGRDSNDNNGIDNRFAVLNQVDLGSTSVVSAKKSANGQQKNKEKDITSENTPLTSSDMGEIRREKNFFLKRDPSSSRAPKANTVAQSKDQSRGLPTHFSGPSLSLSKPITSPSLLLSNSMTSLQWANKNLNEKPAGNTCVLLKRSDIPSTVSQSRCNDTQDFVLPHSNDLPLDLMEADDNVGAINMEVALVPSGGLAQQETINHVDID